MTTGPSEIIHASCVALDGKALLIMGKSGSGKSALALELMAFGADLVADDRVIISKTGGALIASAPDTIAGLIEARGLGILNAAIQSQATIVAVVDLDTVEDTRLPPIRNVTLLGCNLPLFYAVNAPHFAASFIQFLKAGRSTR